MGYYLGSPSERARNVSERLQDLGARRLADMDAAGIDMQILSLTSPGVQVLKADVAVAMARLANDQLAEAVRRHPTRFAGLIAVAPQNPAEAAKEIARGATQLGLKGVIINSHTQGEYLDNPKFWPIFEAAEALGPAGLPASEYAAAEDDRSVSGIGARWCHLRLCGGDGPACASPRSPKAYSIVFRS